MTLSHGPIPSIQWGEMTMSFKKPVTGAMPNLKPGDRVNFEFSVGNEGPQLTAIRPQSGGSVK